ncbi:DUF4034 domain-containing protein [Virgisporangium ochraceum]|uniref:DUF4034 domain-containing protein n=1 Tax=Virgisporangium ochraceum TaxID=65505 RepID=A0A8J4EEH0_9ACTN|nr:DUF4034 domain-containing protein [Virgisporangium ochraceum]GIJ71754.1 hypothetical protein Voc01_066710 [Virgisporangium ochraceum]
MRLFGPRIPDIPLDDHLAQDNHRLRAVWNAVKGGDWRPARDLMADTRTDFDLRAKYVWVLGEASATTTWAGPRVDVPFPVDTTASWADRWAAAEPDNPDAIVVRARSLVMRGWEVRGSGWASTVGADSFEEFHRLLVMSFPLCDEAAKLFPEDPSPWVTRLLLASPLSFDSELMEETWDEIVARDPHHREAHNLKLMYLCQKWSGSHEAMFGFARAAAASAPHGSPLHILPVQANAEWALWEEDRAGSEARVRHVWKSDPRFHAELDAALNKWFRANPERHAMWYHDLNFLAYGLTRAGRYADAKPVFEAIGPYYEQIPWGWATTRFADTDRVFLNARRKALSTG